MCSLEVEPVGSSKELRAHGSGADVDPRLLDEDRRLLEDVPGTGEAEEMLLTDIVFPFILATGSNNHVEKYLTRRFVYKRLRARLQCGAD